MGGSGPRAAKGIAAGTPGARSRNNSVYAGPRPPVDRLLSKYFLRNNLASGLLLANLLVRCASREATNAAMQTVNCAYACAWLDWACRLRWGGGAIADKFSRCTPEHE